MVKTIIVAAIAAIIVLAVFRKIYKDYKKNKNFCGTDCCSIEKRKIIMNNTTQASLSHKDKTKL